MVVGFGADWSNVGGLADTACVDTCFARVCKTASRVAATLAVLLVGLHVATVLQLMPQQRVSSLSISRTWSYLGIVTRRHTGKQMVCIL